MWFAAHAWKPGCEYSIGSSSSISITRVLRRETRSSNGVCPSFSEDEKAARACSITQRRRTRRALAVRSERVDGVSENSKSSLA